MLSGYGIGIVMLSFIFYFSHQLDEDDYVKRNIWKLNVKSVLRAFKLIWNGITCQDTEPWKNNFLSSKVLLIVLLQVLNIGFLLWGAIFQPSKNCKTKQWEIYKNTSLQAFPHICFIFLLQIWCSTQSTTAPWKSITMKKCYFQP